MIVTRSESPEFEELNGLEGRAEAPSKMIFRLWEEH